MGRSRIVVVVSLVAGLLGAAAPAAGAVTDRSPHLAPARGALPAPEPCEGCWTPDPTTSWQWQLQGEIDTSVDVQMYDVDGFEVFDVALNEQCFQYSECNRLRPFVTAGKAVFAVEYKLEVGEFCPEATDLGFNSMRKKLSLRVWREPCP